MNPPVMTTFMESIVYVRSGGVVRRYFDDLDAVFKFDASDDFRQLVFTFQSQPGFGGGVDEFEHHELGGRRRQGSLRPHRARRTVANTLSIGFDVRR
jgi:hypothetical protein